MSARLAVLPGLLAALALVPASAQAQRVSLSPTIGVYIPTSELVKAAEGEEFKQEVALSVGGRLGVTVSPRFGIETSVSYVPSNLRFTFDETQTTTDANLLLGTVRATFHAIPMTSPVWLTINGGASMIRRGGEAYEDVEDRNDVGGVVRRAGPGRGKALGASQDPKDPADVGAALAGGRAVLRGLRFTEGTAILEPSSGSLIGQIAGALARTPGQSLIEAHVDGKQSSATQALSEQRAAAVKAALVAAGSSPMQLAAVGYGASRPVPGAKQRANRDCANAVKGPGARDSQVR